MLSTASKSKSSKIFACSILKNLERMPTTNRGSVFHEKKLKLNSISLSTVYAAISVMLILLIATNMGREMCAFNLLRVLSKLISLTFWKPAKQINLVEPVECIHWSHHGKHFAHVFELAKLYI